MSFSELSLHPRHLLRYVVPFYFEATRQGSEAVLAEKLGYDQFVRGLEGNPKWKPEQDNGHERDVYEYIRKSVLADQGDTDIGRSFRYANQGRILNLRFATQNEPQKLWEFYVTKIGLYVFKTNVGFLWYELELPKLDGKSMDAETLILFQNRIKELYRPHADSAVLQVRGKGVYENFDFGIWIHQLLGQIHSNIHYLSHRVARDGTVEVPDKALLFTLLLLERQVECAHGREELCQLAYYLSNGYTRRYLMSQQTQETMLEPFRDVCWYSSKDGCGYYAYLNSENRKFFQGNLVTKVEDDYFFLYILALHQSYSLNNYLRRLSAEFSADPQQYITASPMGEMLDVFTAELNTFLMKSMYLSVSNILHQNMFFEYLQRSLQVKEDIESINMGMGALLELQRIKKEKDDALREKQQQAQKEAAEKEEQRAKELEQQRQDRSDRQMNFSLAILSVFAVFSALIDSAQLISNIHDLVKKLPAGDFWQALWLYIQQNAPWSVLVLVVYAAILLMAGFFVVTLIRTAVQNRKKK